ncbi:PREDICTED: kinesin-like protein KIN-7O isoform X2 [Nicotiana attenuata]|uniref:kinesin-like protein KIN-7O isoform X2 n=1 Tax=Nicotiana attenuata TaxID=49451 RepID=UPI0009051E1C|nr:PREDICTED: kinesin-like protein KIN-7O isoform X2 [Nicotiana attenuata]
MERIHVSVRARPLSPEDAKCSPWRISGNSIFIPNQPTKFDFDRIFGEECTTLEIYKARTKDIVSAAIQGFNGTVFAYGQTSSGKTYTMRGSATEPGVIPMAVQDLFNFTGEERDREFLLRMSYMEIYNEEINDLLAPEHRKLQIHESVERGIFVAGLREEIVASPDQVLELMDFGECHRHIGETNMNVYSSRSHTIFRMIVESREKAEDTKTDNSCDAVRVSVLNLVDLAGSERAAKTGAEGVRLKEGSHINKSLMTLGTVIKKLSEGAESQGGHVPYRDSKLTRILQPALGGNANTAIICNITLAQIHADETKSSLQFASRALRVTNCVHVNEILTDAALLKRQKKEIEELRSKLQASHSEHPDEEILNLRNTLLKSELERERIALELEEEKKAQVEREKRLQEQAKKIENLSSMVLCSNRDEGRDTYKKDKRRYTCCPGNVSREALKELNSAVTEEASVVEAKRIERDIGPLLPFEELLDADSIGDSVKQDDNSRSNQLEGCTLPGPRALLHVTSRRKGASRKKSSSMEDNELSELQREYEELLLKFESHKTASEVKVDYLTRKLFEADIHLVDGSEQDDNSLMHLNGSKTLRESEAILVIKQLQEKITVLEMERSSSQLNLDSVVEIATEQTISAREKHEELYQELLSAKLEAQGAHEQLASMQSAVLVEDNMNSEIELLREVQDMMSEFENSRTLIDSLIPVVEELVLSFSAISKLVLDLKSSALDSSNQIRSIIRNHEKLQSFLRQKINVVEDEKSLDLHNQIEELKRAIEDSGNALTEISEKCEAEKSEHLSQIQSLQKELSCLSSSSLVREKESIRKDLEKTKAKLRDTESKLRNAIQEKTKLEGERACAEREIKRLNGQRAILERDINKRDSIIGRRRDSVVDRSSNMFDSKRAKNSSVCAEHAVQEEYRKLEVLAFEMETTIASLEEELTISHAEKEEAISRAENLACELQALSDELNMSNTELNMLKEEVSSLRLCSEESESRCQRLETSVNFLVEEKEDLAMQLTDALLAMEEEKAIWFAREKATVEAINEKAKSYSAEIATLSQKMTEVKNEHESCRMQCKLLEERLVVSENNVRLERSFSEEKLVEIDQLRLGLRVAEEQCKRSQEMLTLEHQDLRKEVEQLQMELSMLSKERVDLLARIREAETVPIQRDDFQLSNPDHEVDQLSEKLSSLEIKMHDDEVNHINEKAKLRMRLRGAQSKLDAFRVRYNEALDEMDIMNKKFEEASLKLKDQLVSSGLEILSLKKQLASARGP